MARKSAAALTIAPTVLPRRPDPSKDLTPAQAAIWRTIVRMSRR
jgi:hypothetical protein